MNATCIDPQASSGMTPRDYFAGNAPAMWTTLNDFARSVGISIPNEEKKLPAYYLQVDVVWRYHYADAMLAERAK